VRGFARRRPGTFLLGALAAGIVAGRLARGAKDGSSSSTSPSQSDTHVGPAYDATQASSAFDAPGTTPLATPTAVVETSAPQPVTGVLEVEETPRTGYGDSGPGSL